MHIWLFFGEQKVPERQNTGCKDHSQVKHYLSPTHRSEGGNQYLGGANMLPWQYVNVLLKEINN